MHVLQHKSIIFVVILAFVVALMCGPVSTSGVFAVPPDDNFGGTCEESDDGLTVTCCWRERIPGSILGESYCQTCKRTVSGEGIRIDCDPKELQFLEQPPTPTPFDPTAPLQGGVLEQPPRPPPSSPVAPLQGGVLEQLEQQPTQPLPSPPTAGKSIIPGDTGVLQQLPTDEGEQPRIGSSGGGCQTQSPNICIPCDLGLPGASCIPKSEWPPQEGVLEQPTQPLQSPPTTGDNVLSQPGVLQRLPADEGTAEESAPATEETPPAVDEKPVPPCPEGQVLDEATDLCVPEEEEQQQEPTTEEENQPSDESD